MKRLVPIQTRLRLGYGLNRLRARFLPEPFRSVLPFTMVDLPRLRNLQALARELDARSVAGDVVECGTCNGGSGALLATVAASSPLGRHVWLLDSFEGLPPATEADGSEALDWTGACLGSAERVREVLARCRVPADRVTLVKGWFEETVPALEADRIALLHVDADWYESVLLVLNELYDRVEPGGYVVFDDYGYWEGCRKAADEFLAARQLEVSIVDVDGIGAYFRKP